MDDLSRSCCLNGDCPDQGKRGAGSLSVTGRYGPGKSRRMLRCRTCKARFSERKGTPLFDPDSLPRRSSRSWSTSPTAAASAKPAGSAGWPPTPSPARAAWRATTPSGPTTSSWRYPPRTREVQFDEKWAFVFKKQGHCDPADPADANRGDYLDHVAFDPEHRLVVSVVPGNRSIENADAVVADFHRRTEGRVMDLMTTDGDPAYEAAILHTYGEMIVPPRTGKPGRPKAPYTAVPAGLNYATVEKRREKGRVVEIACRILFGTLAAVLMALKRSTVSRAINTMFVERYHATDRHRYARKARKTYRFSKD